MMSYGRFIGASIIIFGASSWATYQYQKTKRFKEEIFDKQTNKKSFLLDIHYRQAFNYDEYLDKYEKYQKLDQYRKILLSYATGLVLETGVGTSRNIENYPSGCKVIGVDWCSSALEVALLKPVFTLDISYRLEDVEKMTLKDDTFDTVVDTFGMEYYLNPDEALKEMKRVCKKDGLILILTTGKSTYDYLNLFLEFKFPYYIQTFGYFPNRDWESILKQHPDLEIEKSERKMNGTIYYYHLRNRKQDAKE